MQLKSTILTVLKFFFGFGLIAWMIINGMLDLSSLSILAKPVYLIISVLLVFLTIIINNIRWTLLLKMKQFQLTIRQTLPLSLIGVFFNFALPSGVGGDVVKGYYLLKKCPGRKTVAATTLLMDRLMGMYGMVLVSVTIIFIEYSTIRSIPGLYILSIAVIGLFFFMSAFFAMAFSVSIKEHPFINFLFNSIPGRSILQNIYDSIHSYRNNPIVLIQSLTLSFCLQFVIIFFVWFFAGITEAPEVPFSVYMFIVPLGLISIALPISPAGVGVGQASLYYLYKSYTGIDNQIGPNAFTAFQIILLCWGLVGAYFYVTRKNSVAKEQLI